MKWFALLILVLVLGLVASFFWAGKDLKPLDDKARADAPGAFMTLTDGVVHYVDRGPADAPVVVMVHGFSTPHFIFEQNAKALLEQGFRVIQYDHFGRGLSDRPRTKYDIDFYDRELLNLLDALEIREPVGLVGLSMGGPIVAEFAARHPARVSRVALFVSAGLDVPGGESTTARLVQMPLIGDWIWRMNWKKALLGDPQYDESRLAEDARLQGDVTAQMAYKGYSEALLSSLRHFPMRGREPTFQALSETGLPVLAFFGTDDATVAISSADKLAIAIPEADIRRIEGGGHGLNYQRHGDVNPALVAFFKGEAET